MHHIFQINLCRISIILLLSWARTIYCIELVTGPENTSGVVGKSAQLNCHVRNKDTVNVVWFHVDSKTFISIDTYLSVIDLDRRSRYHIKSPRTEEDFILFMDKLKLTDAGNYQCGYLDGDRGFKSLGNALLTVQKPLLPGSPSCEISSPREKPDVGDEITLRCVATGNELQPLLALYRNGMQLRSVDEQYSVEYTLVLEETDIGIEFACVLKSPEFVAPRICSMVPIVVRPEVRIVPEKQEVFKGSDVRFTCDVSSSEKIVSYSWIHLPLPVLLSRRYIEENNGQVLRILNAKVTENNTKVTCQVRTESGLTSNANGTLLVFTRPSELYPHSTTPRHDLLTAKDRYKSDTRSPSYYDESPTISSPDDGSSTTIRPVVAMLVAGVGGIVFSLLIMAAVFVFTKHEEQELLKKFPHVTIEVMDRHHSFQSEENPIATESRVYSISNHNVRDTLQDIYPVFFDNPSFSHSLENIFSVATEARE
ncbi:uncharacterized protein LOC117120865 [Anneissia japonica]|uniref:uncharacterized protein LOC117120865 n=1 Tax=Anneissia japonica TaxID=1529436 RepID=UPI001425AAD1|nr:uncharacterized protein LOC117120865 [Anneissia japonica]